METQNIAWYLALMGSAEEMLKSLALSDLSEHERSPAPNKITGPEFPRDKLGYHLFSL